MKATYNMEPEAVLYMPLPNGKADVWLRKNIQETTEDEATVWTADEVYFRTSLDKESIEANFETLYENGGGGTVVAPDPEIDEISVEEALAIIMGVSA